MIKYEFFRIFSKRSIAFFVIIFITSLTFTFKGIDFYQKILNDQKDFVSTEKEKSGQFVTYDQYGAVGFNIMVVPSPLSIFCYKSIPVRSLETKIDASEKISILTNQKGEAIFNTNGKFHDFFGILSVFVSLLMMIMGSVSFRPILFKSEKCFFKTKILFSRIIILDLFISLLMASMLFVSYQSGIVLTPYNIQLFLIFTLITLIFQDVYFLSGTLLGILFNNKYLRLIVTLCVWFILIFILPELRYIDIENDNVISPKKLDLLKLKNLMDKEAEIRRKVLPLWKDKSINRDEVLQYQKKLVMEFISNEYKFNLELENNLFDKIKNKINSYNRYAIITPPGAYGLMVETLSSAGYDQYKDFVEYVMVQREQYFIDYIDKRYSQDAQEVIPLKVEYIFKSKSYLPNKADIGIIIAIVIGLAFISFIVVYFKKMENKKIKQSLPIDISNLRKGKAYLIYDESVETIECYKYPFSKLENSIIIEKPYYDIGTSIVRWIEYICRKENLEVRKAINFIESNGIDFKSLKKCKYAQRIELFKKVYFTLKIFLGRENVLICNYFDMESNALETYCKKLLKQSDSLIIYISANPAKLKTESSSDLTCIDISSENISFR